MPPEPEAITQLLHLPGFFEPFSAISHLCGAMAFLVLGLSLVRRGRGYPARVLALAVYAASATGALAISGAYHQLPEGGTAALVMQRIDHAAIFIFIAGTFTPVHVILFRGWKRWAPLVVIWAAAILGVTLKSVFFDGLGDWIGLSLYVAMGWAGTFGGLMLWRQYGFRFIAPLFWGGVAYTIGGVFDLIHWPVLLPGVIHPHDVFHIAVLAGALLHWKFIASFAGASLRPLPSVITVPRETPSPEIPPIGPSWTASSGLGMMARSE